MPKVVAAVRQILSGEVYLSPQMATRLLQRAAVGKPLDHNPAEALSNRELQVFEMIGQGMNTVEIARQVAVEPQDRRIAPQGHQDQAQRADQHPIEPPRISVGSRELMSRLQVLGQAADHLLHLA